MGLRLSITSSSRSNLFDKFLPTIIITVELHTEQRGYTLVGREFYLKEPMPRKDVAEHLDGVEIPGEYYVISKKEFMRVVPEARKYDIDSDEVLIPTFAAKPSFRPRYLRNG